MKADTVDIEAEAEACVGRGGFTVIISWDGFCFCFLFEILEIGELGVGELGVYMWVGSVNECGVLSCLVLPWFYLVLFLSCLILFCLVLSCFWGGGGGRF